MAVLRSQRLVAYTSAFANSYQPVYASPAGHRTIIKDIRTSNPAGVDLAVQFLVQAAGSGVQAWLHMASLRPLDVLVLGGANIVLEPGDTLVAFFGLTGIGLWVSGAVLTIPPGDVSAELGELPPVSYIEPPPQQLV